MWRDWLRERPYGSALTLGQPAAPEAVGGVEATLGSLPDDLRKLLRETDGIEGEHGLGVIWPVTRIEQDNVRFRRDFRNVYRPFDDLVFFADAGNGDQFAYRVSGNPAEHSVWVWDHETDERRRIAPDLKSYLDGWLSGEIKI